MEGREGGGGSWETTPSRPLHPTVGTKGEKTEPALGGTTASSPAELGRSEGYPKASPLGARHARPPFPLGPLPEQLSSEPPKTLGPAEPRVTQLRSPRSPHRSCAGAGDAGHVAVLQPPPHALAAPPTPSGRGARTPAPQERAGGGARGAGRRPRGRRGARSRSQPTLVASSLLRSIRARVRDSIRDIIQREPRSDAADPGVQLRRGRGPAARVGLGDRKSESPSPGTQRQFLKPLSPPSPGLRKGGGGAEAGRGTRAPDGTPRLVLLQPGGQGSLDRFEAPSCLFPFPFSTLGHALTSATAS